MFADGEVTSQNVVGYMNGNMIPGQDLMTGAQFCAIGQEELDINTLIPETEYSYEDVGEGFFTIKYYDPNDGITYKYDWQIVGQDKEGVDIWGWYDRINAKNMADGDRKFSAGTGYYFYGMDGTETLLLRSSGEVFSVSDSQEYITLQAIGGEDLGFICPIPVGEIDICDMIPETEYSYEDVGEGFFTIKYYDPNDGITYKYDWQIVGQDKEGVDIWGWYDRINGVAVEKGVRAFDAGEGFYFYCMDGVEEPVLKIKNPFFKAN